MANKSRGINRFSSRSVRKPEHRVFWASRGAAAELKLPQGLRGFFTRFAKKHFRAFPWRAKDVPAFRLLVAEVLLVQTKADDVAGVWRQLVHKYPTPSALAKARTQSLVQLLWPLGLQNQRANSLKIISR